MKYFKNDTLKIIAVAIVVMTLLAFVTGCKTRTALPQVDAAQKPTEVKLITDIETSEDSEYFNVTVSSTQPLTYTSVKQMSPLGVVFYFPETALDFIKTDYRVGNDAIENIKASELTEEGSSARIEIQLKNNIPYTVARNGNGIKIAFVKPLTVAMIEKPVTEVKEIKVAKTEEEEEEEPKKADLTSLPVASKLESIYATQSGNSVKIKLMADGVIRDFNSFIVDNPARIVLDIKNLKQAQPRKKEQIIPVNTKWVKSVRHFGYPDKLRMVLDTEKPYQSTYSTTPMENGLLVEVGSELVLAAVPVKKSAENRAEQLPKAALVKPAADKSIAEESFKKEKKEPIITKTEPSADTPIVEESLKSETKTPLTAKAQLSADRPAAEKPLKIEKQKPSPLLAKAESPAASETPAQATQPAWVNRIDFSSEKSGKSTLIIGTTRFVKYDIKQEADKRIQLKLFDTKLPEYRKRPLITTRFQSAVDRILPFEAPALKDASLFAIELRESVPYVVEQAENLLMVHFEASSIPPKPLDEAKLPAWKTVMAQTTLSAAEPEMQPKPAAEQEKVVTEPVTGITKVYTGEKIALDFFDTDIKNVFRILREVSRKNFAIDKGVGGKVTLTLEQPVPWDQVLDLILKMNGLGMTYEGDIIRIAKRETLEKEEKALRTKLAAERKAMREEKKEEKELEPLVTEYIAVNYASASSEIMPKVKPVLTKDRGKISVDDRNNQLIVTDVAGVIDQVKEIVRKIDKVTPQVLIEARIVEATNTFTRAIGTQWKIDGGPNSNVTDTLGGALTYDMSATNPAAGPLGQVGINFTRLVGTPFSLINARLTASETEGDLNIISAPKILTLNNKRATIKQGVRYPYNKLVDGETRTEFINVDLMLEVEPLVTPDSRIAMKLKVTNNELGAVVNAQQSFTTKEAETELLVNDGETVVIGGIRKTTKQNNISGVPVMKDIPVLGWLFKSKSITDNKEELLIFITPQIVQLEQRG